MFEWKVTINRMYNHNVWFENAKIRHRLILKNLKKLSSHRVKNRI